MKFYEIGFNKIIYNLLRIIELGIIRKDLYGS